MDIDIKDSITKCDSETNFVFRLSSRKQVPLCTEAQCHKKVHAGLDHGPCVSIKGTSKEAFP